MKIGNRKVNGRIMIDASDVVNGFTIVIVDDEVMWVTNSTVMGPLDPRVAVSHLNSLIDARILAIRFTIAIKNGAVYKVITSPNYTFDGGITIDISALVPGKELKINLLTGKLSVVAITNS